MQICVINNSYISIRIGIHNRETVFDVYSLVYYPQRRKFEAQVEK